MASRGEQRGYAILREDFGLLRADSLEDFQHAVHLCKVKENENVEVVAETFSANQANVLEHRHHDGQVHTSRDVLRFHEGRSYLGDYTNSLCLEQNLTPCDVRNGQVDGFPLQMYSAGADWPGGIFVSSSSTPTESTRGSINEIHIPNYLALSIIVTLMFFAPIGIFAILFAVKANNLKKQGIYSKAKETATQALHLNISAVVMGVICYAATGFLVWYNIQRMEKLANHH